MVLYQCVCVSWTLDEPFWCISELVHYSSLKNCCIGAGLERQCEARNKSKTHKLNSLQQMGFKGTQIPEMVVTFAT